MSEAGDGMFSTRTFDKEETGLRMFGNKQICVYFFFLRCISVLRSTAS